ncbi:hypothetical protein [Pseudalkalibacillus caeni]|uniref:ABC transporter periplasmic binding protein yphF n=1 Tax=Exobacillus caeni TaxID=2574798 RepID=A0A5R9F2Z8_9BACL|nr:hypothetical protein [Pseudalkalibacillus caeni]TLS35928.1 hypothetical protein FCL54_18210 [Pseudalkalibacillus caeni]
MKMLRMTLLLCTLLLLLSGCLYPESKKMENRIPYKDQIESVQTGVDQFQQDSGVLPIKTRDMTTPLYQKYPIDFKKLVPRYLQQPPGNSFENGGVFQYVLINVEENPTVRVLDLTMVEKVKDLQMRINDFRRENKYPPFKEILAKNRYSIDYERMGIEDPPTVKSPYTGKQLPFFLDESGSVWIDYTSDLEQALESKPEHNFQPGEDIRNILAENSFFVPTYSVPYTIKNNKPVFLVK